MSTVEQTRTDTGTELNEPVATWVTVVGNSDYYWRCTAPARAIGAKWIPIPEVGGYYAITQPNDDTVFPWTVEPDVTYSGVAGSAVVWTRPDPPRAVHAEAMEKFLGVRTVSETDDNYLANTKFNIHMKSNGFDRGHRMAHLKSVASMNAAIFTTEWLRDAYWKEIKANFKGTHRLPEMFVCGNHLFPEDWPTPVPRTGPVRVGWMGSPSHIWDLDLAYYALRFAAEAGADVQFVGYDPANPEHAIETRRSAYKVAQWRKVPANVQGWRRLSDYERLSLPLDIGLCPLLTNEFTLGKSDIKAVEYTISGAAVVASNMPVYNKTWVHGETALLAGSPEEFLKHVELLMRDENLRQRLVANAQQYVREERDIRKHRAEWEAAVLGY